MNVAKITFEPLGAIVNEEEAIDLLWDYTGTLYKNGQILKNYEIIKAGSGYMAFVTLPEDNSLDIKYNSVYVSKYLEELEKLFSICSEIIGENLNNDVSCTCQNPSWYMLYTNYSDNESPVVCGDCGKSVPLYKLPYLFGESECFKVLGWKEAYSEVDNLYMYCLSDRFTYRQMNDVKSQLAKIGLDICQEYEKATGVPFFYYLFHLKKTPDKCPVCGGDWKLKEEESFIDYKCDNCKLVADET